MERLGYWDEARTKWRPYGFGSTWTDRTDVPEWYEWMYESRRPQHERLISFIEARDDLRTIVDVGCGVGVGYHDGFADRTYVGVDLSRSNIEWCREHRKNQGHRYLCVDHATTDPDPGEIGDIAFSQGTIDNAWDVDEFLAGMVRWSRRLIHVTCYRGWFPELGEHRYRWNAEHGCFYNDISPGRVRRTLERLGCTEIEIGPSAGEGLPCRETVITARVPEPEGGS
jgi:SAM-dependent methyltransferase